MKIFEVILSVNHRELIEAEDAAEARECMKIRSGRIIAESGRDYEISAEETQVPPHDMHKVLVK